MVRVPNFDHSIRLVITGGILNIYSFGLPIRYKFVWFAWTIITKLNVIYYPNTIKLYGTAT